MSDAAPPVPPVPPATEQERVPFWGYADVFLVAGLSLPCMFLGWGTVRLAMWLSHLHTRIQAFEAVPMMLIGYLLLFGVMSLIFRMQYDRPFWRSLGWTAPRISTAGCVFLGFATTLAVGWIGLLIHTPPTTGPLIEMMKDRQALVLLAIYGTAIAPVAEELVFRGFLQPLLVRNLGVVAGIALTSLLFGGLHYSEYGDSWRPAFLVALSGAAFGAMRHWTGSTRAAGIMHAAFNGLQFAYLFTPKH